MSVFKF